MCSISGGSAPGILEYLVNICELRHAFDTKKRNQKKRLVIKLMWLCWRFGSEEMASLSEHSQSLG
jgi:hypothetical protein